MLQRESRGEGAAKGSRVFHRLGLAQGSLETGRQTPSGTLLENSL